MKAKMKPARSFRPQNNKAKKVFRDKMIGGRHIHIGRKS